MPDKQFSYLLFIKMYRADLHQSATTFIERQPIDIEEKRTLHVLTTSFVNFLANQRTFSAEALDYWVQVNSQSVTVHNELFVEALSHALTEILKLTQYTHREEVLAVHEELVRKSKVLIKQWYHEVADEQFSATLQRQMDLFSKELIRHNGSEDLAILLKRAEEIFDFKRCIFISYNPWLEEFSGVIGAEIDKIERLRGKIDIEPVFMMKKPLFLKNPAPYVQQVAIEMLDLSSVIFIPVIHEQQLYGWLSFDQVGEAFDCSQQQLLFLQEAGNRLAMYIGRKQLRNRLNRNISLTEKELMILYLLVEGFSNKEMAHLMYISEYTVRDYVKGLMQKLNARNRTHVISLAFRSGLVD